MKHAQTLDTPTFKERLVTHLGLITHCKILEKPKRHTLESIATLLIILVHFRIMLSLIPIPHEEKELWFLKNKDVIAG